MKPEHLDEFNRRLKNSPYDGVILVCPYSPLLSPLVRLETPEYESYIVEELIPALKDRYRVASGSVGVDGVSMGGARSMYYGFKYPNVFSSIGSVQGAFGPYLEIYSDLVRTNRDILKTKAIQLVTSDGDSMAPSVEKMHRLLDSHGISHRYLTPLRASRLYFQSRTRFFGAARVSQPGSFPETYRPDQTQVISTLMNFDNVRKLMNLAIEEEIFTGAVVSASYKGDIVYQEPHGTLGGSGTGSVTLETLFDLASLTKILATTPCWIILATSEPEILNSGLPRWFPESPLNKQKITPRHLLAHASGLPAWRPFYLTRFSDPPAGIVLERILGESLEYPTGQGCIYSDLGFMLLAWIIECETGEDLETFSKERIYKPLGMKNDLIFRPDAEKRAVAWTRTGRSPWSC